ncbi:hypothetical protein R4L22_07545 [Brachyspira pilosicoli]|uniref:hypothetical protein n=1 Tax=Brachyspira pilosicoli TaxID=52584 RepID=UPI0012F529E5|nr:hypothetical protein [Brachyspira pilosicoli]
MNKKILSIIFSLFLVGVFSISCSSKEDPKGIEQYNGNIYASESKDIFGYYLWLSVKDNKVAYYFKDDNTTIPEQEFNESTRYIDVEGSGSKYTCKGFGEEFREFTLEFSEDGSAVTAHVVLLGQDGSVTADELFKCVKKN